MPSYGDLVVMDANGVRLAFVGLDPLLGERPTQVGNDRKLGPRINDATAAQLADIRHPRRCDRFS